MRSDHELLTAWGDGDTAAGRELFGRHFTSIFRFFRNKVDDAADDLTQQTFVACLKAREGFRGDSSFRTFLFSIARRRLYDHLRLRLRRAPKEAALGERSIADIHGPSPTRLIAAQQEQALLLRALRRLPVDMQVALELWHRQYIDPPAGDPLAKPS